MAESVDAPDLKSVGHYARESSSLSTPTINTYNQIVIMSLKEKFISWFTGYFNNQRQAFHRPREFAMIELTHTAVEGEDDTFRVMQKYVIDPDPYRQAIIVIEEQGEDILLKSYNDDEERAYKEGCDVRFRYEEELDRFVGANLCDTCMVERVPGVPSYLKTEAVLGEDYYSVKDTGHNPETHDQIWGSQHGFFEFDRK